MRPAELLNVLTAVAEFDAHDEVPDLESLVPFPKASHQVATR